jgi:hypothetical protein
MSAALVKYDEMCRAIDQAFEVDEVKDIRDKAMAFEAYSKQARNTEAERRACEIRLRAERKAGSLLSTMEKAKGALKRGLEPPQSRDATTAKTLSQLGISKDQSSRWQQLAAIPEAEFEEALAAPDKPTTNGIIVAANPPRRSAMDGRALWLWGRLQDFERQLVLSAEPSFLLREMTEPMRVDVRRLAPLVIAWLEGLDNDQ